MTKHTIMNKRMLGAATAGAVLLGAVAGSVDAAARDIRKVRKGEMSRKEAALDVAREAGTTGLATGAAVAVVGALGLGGVLSVLGVAAVATGAKYLLDSALDQAPAKVKALKATAAAKTAAATKAPAKAAKPVKAKARTVKAKAAPAPVAAE